ncbi:MAG TPA: MFS transporter, partial [Pseudonocardia sp.]|nr:MFS transporter [Pseudonocardia sp.]
ARPGPRGPAPAAAPGQAGAPAGRSELRAVYVAALAASLVVFVPLVHVAGYASDAGLTATQGATLIAVMSGASAVARLGTGWLGAPHRLLTLYRGCHLVLAAAFTVWALTGSGGAAAWPMLLVFAVLFGLGYGGWLALGPALLASRCDPRRLGRALGVLAALVGTGGVVGPLLAGALLTAPGPPAVLAGCAALAGLAAALLRPPPANPASG